MVTWESLCLSWATKDYDRQLLSKEWRCCTYVERSQLTEVVKDGLSTLLADYIASDVEHSQLLQVVRDGMGGLLAYAVPAYFQRG